MEKLRVTYHNGRRRKDGSAFNAKHNSRSGGIGTHIDLNADRKDIYITVDASGTPTLHDKVDFDKHEQSVYNQLFGKSLEAQNERYRRKGNYDRIHTMDEYRQSRPPEESVFQVGKMDEEVDPNITLTAIGRWVDEMKKLYGTHWKILDIAVHYSEPGTDGKRGTNASGHAHVRAVWCADGKDGYTASENKALQQLGIERPDVDKPQSRYNNPKITFTQRARDLWVSKVQELNVDVETTPAEPGKRTLTKEEYMTKQIRKDAYDLTVKCEQTAEEVKKIVSERDSLQEQVNALKQETSRLRAILGRFKRIFRPIVNLLEKLASIRVDGHKSALDEVLLDAKTAGSIDALRELEEEIL